MNQIFRHAPAIGAIRKTLVGLVLLVISLSASAQSLKITGTVTDATNGESVIGAVVVVKGTQNAAQTDIDGAYSLSAKVGDVLVCTIIGYETKEITLDASSKVVDFSLSPDTFAIEETVIVGYGTLKKTQLVGAVETLSSEVLEGKANADVTRSLQGQIPGLNIIQTDGKPSHSGSIYIRGNSTTFRARKSTGNAETDSHSIGQGGSALVLIDGVEGTLASVNPDDILSVSVLKDAASAAVYGARGAYGVILVTTKTPAKETIRVTYNGQVSIKSRIIKWEDNLVTDGYTWATKFIEFFQGDQRVPGATGNFPSNVAGILDFSPEYYAELQKRAEAGYNDQFRVAPNGKYEYFGNTNWYSLIFRRNNTAQTHNVTIQGSSDKVKWLVSGRFHDQDSIYKLADEVYKTYDLRSKGSVQIRPWLTLENNTSLHINAYRQPTLSSVGSATGNIYEALERFGQPIAIPFNEDGTYTRNAGSGGYQSLHDNRTYQEETVNNLTTSTALNFTIIPEVLTFKADYSYKHNESTKERVAVPLYAYSGEGIEEKVYINDYKSKWQYDVTRHSANAVLTFTPKLGSNHDLNLMVGGNVEKESRRVQYTYMMHFLDPDYPNFSLMPADEENYPKIDENGSYDKGFAGIFTRVNYTLLSRYIFEFAGRYDGSSLFPSHKQWGLFPSASIGWRVSEEPWMQATRTWLNNLKLRANMGSMGNAQVSPYTYMQLYSTSKSSSLINGNKFYYISSPGLVPKDLTWETVNTYDAGLDLDVLGNRLSFSGDYYVRETTDLYTQMDALPAVLGTSTPKGNYGTLQTKGWEATLGWKDQTKLAGKAFSYSFKASVWDSRTWVKQYNNQSNSFWGLYEGKEMGEIWGFSTAGIFRDNEEANSWVIDEYHKNGSNWHAYAGDLKFIDINGNGKIDIGKDTLQDHGDLDRIGNSTPHYQFGFNMDFNWNNIGLSIFLQGVGRRDWYPDVESGFFWGMYNRPYGYLPKEHLSNGVQIDYSTDNWTVVNYDDNPFWTRPVGYCANRNVGPLTMANDHYLMNARYLRLKNITLDYTLPKDLVKKADIESVKVWVSADNLFTFSPIYKYTSMFDPESITSGDSDFNTTSGLYGVGEGYSYPMQRSITFGVNLTF